MSGPIQAAGTGPIPADIPVPSPLTEVTVTALPERLQQLARTVQIAGQVIAQEDGTATVRTAVGDVVVRTPVPLPTDRPVVLQIAPPPLPNAPPPPALVLLLGSPTAPATAAPPGGGSTAPGIGTPGTPTLATPTLATPAIAAPAGAAPVAPLPALPTLQPGAVVSAVVIQAAAPQAAGTSQAATLPGALPTPVASPIVTATAPVASAPVPGALAPAGPPGTAAATAPPSATTPAPAPPSAPQPNTGAALPVSPAPAGAASSLGAIPVPGGPSTAADPAAAPVPQVWAGLPPLARSIPLTAPTPTDTVLPPQLAAAAALAELPAAEAGELTSPPAVAGRMATTASGAPAAATAPLPAAAAQPAAPIGPRAATAPQIAMVAFGALPEEAINPPAALPAAPASPPTAAPAATAQGAPARTTAAQTATASAASAAPAAPVLPPLRQGATVQLTVLAVGPEAEAPAAEAVAAAPTAAKQVPAPGAPLSGRLEGTTSRGQPVVTTPAGTLLLSARTDLPAGTPIRMEAALPELAAEAPAEAAPIDPLQGRTWPALKEVLATLNAIDPRLAHSVAQHVLPQPTPKLTTSLLAFLGALRGGNAAGWLGDAASGALERAGRGDLLSRLSDDFRALGMQGQERLVGDWRALTVPFGQMGDVRAFQFAVRQPDPEEAGTTAVSRATRRFLIDIEFTKLGAMQLDGLTSAGRFDLVIRSLQLLPGGLKHDLLTIFSGSLQAVGFTGQLAFQNGAQQWVKLTPAKRRATQT